MVAAARSNFSDFTINAGVSATFDGLIIADGNATGASGGTGFLTSYNGAAAAGGVWRHSGALTLTNSVLQNDTAQGRCRHQLPAFPTATAAAPVDPRRAPSMSRPAPRSISRRAIASATIAPPAAPAAWRHARLSSERAYLPRGRRRRGWNFDRQWRRRCAGPTAGSGQRMGPLGGTVAPPASPDPTEVRHAKTTP